MMTLLLNTSVPHVIFYKTSGVLKPMRLAIPEAEKIKSVSIAISEENT